jgi:hypothetical protein
MITVVLEVRWGLAYLSRRWRIMKIKDSEV